ncbi:MAG: MarR family winged helix-turn-helix transcriptional regulator [Pseudomonadales bacterium]
MANPIIRPLSLDELREVAENFPDLDPQSLEVYNELTRTTRLLVAEIDRLSQERPTGMSASRNTVLWAIMRYQGEDGITPAEIADALDITRATVTGLLSALEKDGLINRVHSVEDRRKVHVKATVKAEQYTQVEWPMTSADITRAMSMLSEREKSQLLKMMRKIRQGTYQI